jgi:hypothetical protein
MAPVSKTLSGSGKKKSVSYATTSVTIGAPVKMAPTGGPQPEGAFLPVDFQARQDAMGLKRRTGKPLAGTKSTTKKKPTDVPPTTVER